MEFEVNPFDPESFNCFSEILNTDPKRFDEILEGQDEITRQLILSSIFYNDISMPLVTIMAELTNDISVGEWFKDSDNLPQKFMTNTEIFKFLKDLSNPDLTDIINEFDIPNTQKQKLYSIVKESDENEFNKWIDEFRIDISILSKFIYHFKNLKQNISTDFNFIPSEDKALDFLQTLSPDLAEKLYVGKFLGLEDNDEDDEVILWINFLNQFNLMPYNIMSSSNECIKSQIPFPYYIKVINLKNKPIISYLEEIKFNEGGKDGNVIMQAFSWLNEYQNSMNEDKKSYGKKEATTEPALQGKENSTQHNNFQKLILGKSQWIFNKCIDLAGSKSAILYEKFLEVLYEIMTGMRQHNIQLFVPNFKYFDCTLSDFKFLFDANPNKNEVSENPQLKWINNENQVEMRAFLQSFFCEDNNGNKYIVKLDPGRKTACYSYDNRKILLSQNSDKTIDIIPEWKAALNKCIELAFEEMNSQK